MVEFRNAQLTELLTCGNPNDQRPPKPITSAFELHMGVFVDAQDRFRTPINVP